MNQVGAQETGGHVRVERWPTERPLLVLVAIAAAALWVALIVSVIGFLYAAFIGLFLFFSHLGFIAYLRGSAIRLGPDQLPELHARVIELANRVGLTKEPEVYVMQAGGALNALATGFLRSRIVVLFSDLLEACGDNEAARDMIIGHELGHIKAGHLTLWWLLFPGFLVPFLGTAYSRAREYTCDRYGAAVCGDRQQGLVGLGILAAGGAHGRRVNLKALASQREQLNTGFMTIGKWLSTHPPLSERLVALEPRMSETRVRGEIGVARALVGMAVTGVVFVGVTALFVRRVMPAFQQALEQAQSQAAAPGAVVDNERVIAEMVMLAELAVAHRKTDGSLPADPNILRDVWEANHPDEPFPRDPYDGHWYGYEVRDNQAIVWSSGPDGRNGTSDDIVIDSQALD